MADDHSHHHSPAPGDGHAHLVDILDYDAEVLRDFHREVIAWAGTLVPARPRIIDLGAGTGTGTLALARHLPDAEVTAVDVDEQMLTRLHHHATEAGLADRIHPVRVDLDGTWPDLGPADLVWASASLHHLADPARALGQVRATLRTGGYFLITELDSFPRFLTDPAGVILEDHVHDAQAALRREAGLHMGEDWGARLKAAGFEVEAERRFDIELPAPLSPTARRYAQLTLERAGQHSVERLSAPDRTALAERAAAAPGNDSLSLRATRTVWLGRRP